MRLWTSWFSPEYEASPHGWIRKSEYARREMDLEGRREALRRLELESYAALGKKLSAALQDISIFEANARPGHPVVVEVSLLEWAAEPLFSWVEK